MEGEDLPQDQVHLWYAFPDSCQPKYSIEQAHILSLEERERWQAFRFEADRHDYLVAHLLLRDSLCRYVGCLPQDLEFSQGPFGKPSLAEPRGSSPLEFSLTHTRGLVACVVARHPVGTDAESLDKTVDLELAPRVLAPAELDELSGQPPERRSARFLEYWTLKEAFVKATGKGLSQPLQQFWFQLDRAGEPTIDFAVGEPARGENWQFLQVNQLSPAHRLAVAVKLPGPTTLHLETRAWSWLGS